MGLHVAPISEPLPTDLTPMRLHSDMNEEVRVEFGCRWIRPRADAAFKSLRRRGGSGGMVILDVLGELCLVGKPPAALSALQAASSSLPSPCKLKIKRIAV